jgi:hypothetical protein
MSYFVFLEFASQQVRDFLEELRNALSGYQKASPAHVTLRGPFVRPPNPDQIERFADRLRGYGVRIGNHGYFTTPRGFSVFLRAECVVFREMWYKPDFRSPLKDIQPHITVFESNDLEAVQEVSNFLREENILIRTYDVYLRIYQSRMRQEQPDFFGPPIVSLDATPISQDVWDIRASVLDRARALGIRLSVHTR